MGDILIKLDNGLPVIDTAIIPDPVVQGGRVAFFDMLADKFPRGCSKRFWSAGCQESAGETYHQLWHVSEGQGGEPDFDAPPINPLEVFNSVRWRSSIYENPMPSRLRSDNPDVTLPIYGVSWLDPNAFRGTPVVQSMDPWILGYYAKNPARYANSAPTQDQILYAQEDEQVVLRRAWDNTTFSIVLLPVAVKPRIRIMLLGNYGKAAFYEYVGK